MNAKNEDRIKFYIDASTQLPFEGLPTGLPKPSLYQNLVFKRKSILHPLLCLWEDFPLKSYERKTLLILTVSIVEN